VRILTSEKEQQTWQKVSTRTRRPRNAEAAFFACELNAEPPNPAVSKSHGGVIKRIGTGEEPVTGLPVALVPLPQPATFRTVTSTLPH
jgi:hypothetical protein